MSAHFVVTITQVTRKAPPALEAGGTRIRALADATLTLQSMEDFKGSVSMDYSAQSTTGGFPAQCTPTSPPSNNVFIDVNETETITVRIDGDIDTYVFTAEGTSGSIYDADSEQFVLT